MSTGQISRLAHRSSRVVVDAERGDSLGIYYTITDDHRVVPASRQEWEKQTEDIDARRVGYDEVVLPSGHKAKVSTVFIGINVGTQNRDVFETKVFGGPYDQKVQRYATWAEAERGHQVTVNRLKNGYSPYA